MRILVIGLGSMGKRRIRLLKRYSETIEIIGVDNAEHRCREATTTFGINVFSSIEEALLTGEFHSAFICTAPLTHHHITKTILESGMNVFSELNLVADGYQANIALAEKKGKTLFLSSTMLYRKEVQQIQMLLNQAKCPTAYHYHIGQYLPDWHPWESYKDFFVGDRRSNGCREIFAIELPWLIKTFGDIVAVNVLKNRMSQLEINFPDTYQVLIQHASGHQGALTVDVVSRQAIRKFEVFGENIHLFWDGSPEGLFQYDIERKESQRVELYDQVERLSEYSHFVVENAYLSEIEQFFDVVNTGKSPTYSFEKDFEILNWIDRIED